MANEKTDDVRKKAKRKKMTTRKGGRTVEPNKNQVKEVDK